MYYSDDVNSGVELYCREKDKQKFKDYYDQVNHYYTGIYDDGSELTKISCSKKEIEALWNIEKQKKYDLTVENQEKSCIFIKSKDGIIRYGMDLSQWHGKWYYVGEYLKDDIYHCYRLPASIEEKINNYEGK